MRPFRAIIKELTRPRGHKGHRFYRIQRSSRAGIALLLVMTSLMFMTVLMAEIGYAATVRLQLAAHQRDEAAAEGLAMTGVQIYRLILVASKQMGSDSNMIGQALAGMGINAGDMLWQMLPYINTGLMRMIFVSGGSVDEGDVEDVKEQGGLSEAQIAESRESVGRDKNFLDFDGDFFAEVVDEDRKINVTGITATTYSDLLADQNAIELYSLMTGTENDDFFNDINVERWELVANLVDWQDADMDRLYLGGSEESLYDHLDDPYLPKNAGFDSFKEIRLVDGWHRDDIWERFGKKITVYGSGKVNINTAPKAVLFALLKAHLTNPVDVLVENTITLIQEYRAMANFSSEQAFIGFLSAQGVDMQPSIKTAITTKSTVFRVTSTGQVGEASATITAILDFSNSDIGEVVYWGVE